MKIYGNGMKATEFSRKQVGVIFGKAKSGQLNVERWMMSEMYDLADYYGYDDNRSIESEESQVLSILDSVFSGQIGEAQEKIDRFQDQVWALMSNKARKTIDRTVIVK